MGKAKEAHDDFDTFLREGDPGISLVFVFKSYLLLLSFINRGPNAYFGKAQLYIEVNNIAKAEEAFALGCQKGSFILIFSDLQIFMLNYISLKLNYLKFYVAICGQKKP